MVSNTADGTIAPSSAPPATLPGGTAETWTTIVRFIVLLTLVPASALGIITGPPPGAVGVLAWLGCYVVLLAVGPRWVPVFRRADVSLVLDLIVTTLLIVISGDLNSPFLYLYYLVILEAAVRLNLRHSVATSIASGALLILLGVRGGHAEALTTPGFRLGLFIAGGFMLGLVSGIFSQDHPSPREVVGWDVLLDRRLREATVRLEARLEELSRLAQTDGLTGLANHRALREALVRETAEAGRFGHPVSVVLVELDKFKQVNDQYGHMRGDAVLRSVAEAMKNACRTMDLAARFGGDEFVLLLPQTPKAAAAQVAERLRHSLEKLPLPDGVRLTASLGVASMPDDETSADGLLEAADRAMYQVKNTGGNRVGLN